MNARRLLMTVFAATVFAACSAAGASPAASPAASGGPSTPTGGGTATATVQAVTSSGFGTVLTGANGLTLYTSSGDSVGTSACTGSCATAWPPLTVPAGQQPTAGPGVTGALSTVARADGTTQVAHDGLPLYFWQGDSKPGDVTGDGVNGFSVAKAAGGAGPAPSAPASGGGKPGY